MFHHVSRFRPMVSASALLSLLALSSCAYQLPPQQTVFITRSEPDRLSEILNQKPLPKGKVAVLGGQILRRYDSPVGRYFLIRDLPLDKDAYPHPPKGKIVISSNNEFVLFTPALHIIGEHRATKKTNRSKSAFVVFGRGHNETVSMGPGHIITAVGEISGMAPFPLGKDRKQYLLLVSQYVMLWSRARPEDYPLVPRIP